MIRFIKLVILVLGLVACGEPQPHWVVHKERSVAFGQDTTIKASMLLVADSGPSDAAAYLTFSCTSPSNPAPSLAIRVSGLVLDQGLFPVRSRADAAPVASERWFSSSGDFAIPSERLEDHHDRAVRLWHARVLRMEVPTDRQRVAFRFPVAGFDTAFTWVSRACGGQ